MRFENCFWLRLRAGKTTSFTSELEDLAFVRSGNVNINDGRVNYVGEWGWDWSRTAQSSTNAYNLQFGVSTINPSNNNNRWNGFPLR